jgi:hypothetical protein
MAEQLDDARAYEPSDADKTSFLRDSAGVRSELQIVCPLASARLLDRLANLVVQTSHAVVAIVAERKKLTLDDNADLTLGTEGALVECIRDSMDCFLPRHTPPT